jgi:poly(A) polymerase
MTDIDLRHLDRDPGARQALERVWPVLPQARLVGGVVRDLIAGKPVADIDLATPEPPQAVMRRLADAGIRTVATGLAHGTVTAVVHGHPIEITTLRRDEETDGRHAVVAWTENWREDAQRRDFTINAMSLARDLTLFDYFGGLEDLRAGRVRFVGQAALRIAEDRLRILRFFRFHARYGRDPADPEAVAAIETALPGLDALSAERVWSELRRILTGPELAPTALLMSRLGVLDRLLPGGAEPHRLVLLLESGLPPDPVLRLAALIKGPAAPIAQRLRLSNAEAARLEALLAPPVPRPEMDDADLRRLLADDPADLLCGRAWLIQAGSAADRQSWGVLRRRLEAMPRPVFPLAGRDVLACGLPPGPEVGRLLAATRAWWLAGGCVADRAACLDRLCALGGGPRP